jgi:hypothetical protein
MPLKGQLHISLEPCGFKFWPRLCRDAVLSLAAKQASSSGKESNQERKKERKNATKQETQPMHFEGSTSPKNAQCCSDSFSKTCRQRRRHAGKKEILRKKEGKQARNKERSTEGRT